MPEITGIAHVELSVTDLARSREWYERVLGMETVFNEEQPELGIVASALLHRPTGIVVALTQHLNRPASTGFDRFSPVQPGLDHLSFAVADREKLKAWQEHLASLEIDYTPLEEWSHGAAVTARDPDGIALEFYVRGPKPG